MSPGFTPSSGGVSSSASSSRSLPLSITLGIGRYRKNGNRVKRLCDVIKILKYAIKTQEQALKARKNALAAIKSWAGELRDDTSREVIGQVNDVANGQWTIDSDFSPKIQAIISRLSELKKEEDTRDKAHKAVIDAEKTYYRALYKNYPRSEIEILEKSCKNLKEKSKTTDIQFQNSTAATLNHCLNMFFHQLFASCESNRGYAEKVINVLDSFENNNSDSVKKSGAFQDQENTNPDEKSIIASNNVNEEECSQKKLTDLMSGNRNSLRFEDIFPESRSKNNTKNLVNCTSSTTLPLEPHKKPQPSNHNNTVITDDDRASEIVDFNHPAFNHFESSASINHGY